ncbi:peptidoglycan binding protein CsiV [Salinivibrio sp. ES.052]|uniref:peptidoglycan binding protein CsiV n=1 Tax=Salinivibrio sp. ES.052 TaxID=1882823 RepID=UPI0009281934|nr:peptidoglycan binding protein CsiV [Salinivibrio sp. ES.052]SIN83373.1 Peptidoglycan-binding protein, CsiV [Salinivibrio sp. ES.052]
MRNHQRPTKDWRSTTGLKGLMVLLLLSLSQPVWAKRLYDVELIVFKRNQDPASVQENWPPQAEALKVQNAISVTRQRALQSAGLTPLPKSQWQLNNAYNKLANHAGFTPMVHVAWRQDDSGRSALPLLRVTAGQDFSDRFYTDGTPIKARPQPDKTTSDGLTKASWEEENLSAPSSATQGLFELDGTLRVYVQHYLFVEADMILRQPSERRALVEGIIDMPLQTADAPVNQNEEVQVAGLQKVQKQYHIERFLQPYGFTHKRRMRSGETHYLDNPMMGMIIQVRKAN